MNEFDAIMQELNAALDKKADAEVGDNSPVSKGVGDVDMYDSDMTEEAMLRKDRSTAYQDTVERDPKTPAVPTSEIGAARKARDKAEVREELPKSASSKAEDLLRKIDSYVERSTIPSIEKSAAYVRGQEAGEEYLNLLIKRAEDNLQVAHNVLASCVKEGHISGEERDRILSEMASEVDITPEKLAKLAKDEYVSVKLIQGLFPHLQSDNKSPETMPMQQAYQPAPQVPQRALYGEDTMEAVTGATIDKKASQKAMVMLELEKAAAANDGPALAIAKAKFMDLLLELQENN